MIMVFFKANIDECASTPCQNAGTCIDDVNQYSCDCIDGIIGTHCESKHTNWLLNIFKLQCLFSFLV